MYKMTSNNTLYWELYIFRCTFLVIVVLPLSSDNIVDEGHKTGRIVSKRSGIWISLSWLTKLACKFLHNEIPAKELLFLLPSKLQVVFSSNLFVVCKGHTSCTEAKLWCCWKIEFFFPVRGYYCMLSPWNWKWEIPVSQKFQKKYDAAYIFWSDF